MPNLKIWLLAALVCGLGGIAIPSSPRPSPSPSPFQSVEMLAHRTCPDHQLENLTGGDWEEIMLDGKGPAFTVSVEHRLAGSERRFSRLLKCAELVTVDCDVAASLSAIEAAGLMKNAVEQICRDWRCEDETTCTYLPRNPRR